MRGDPPPSRKRAPHEERASFLNLTDSVPRLNPRGPGIRKRDVVEQADAVNELRLISQPPGFTLEELGNSYFYNDTTVANTQFQTVYSLDKGAELSNPASIQ